MGMPIRNSPVRVFSLVKARKYLRKTARDLSAGHRDKARAKFRSVLEALPEASQPFTPSLRKFVLEASRVARRLDGSSRIAGLLRSYLSDHRGDREAWLALAEVLVASQNIDDAIEACDEGVEAVEEGQDLLFLKGELLGKEGKEKDALEVFWNAADGEGPWLRAWDAIESIEGPSARLWMLKGTRLREGGNVHGSLEAFDRALEEDPRCVDAFLGKARILLGMDRWQEAYDCVCSAIELKSTRSDLWQTRAIAEEGLDRYSDAARSLEVGLRYEPYNLELLKRSGRLLLETDKHEEAVLAYRRAFEIAPEGVDVLEGWRESLRRSKRWDEYREVCRNISDLHPQRWDVLLDEARSWIHSGHPEQAQKLLEGVVDGGHNNSEVYAGAAELATRAEFWKIALRASRCILEAHPRDYDALRYEGMALKGMNRREEALKALTKAARLHPDVELLQSRRDILKSLGPSKALHACCEHIVRLDPKSEEAHLEVIQAAAKLGKVKLALRACDRGLRELPGNVGLLLLKAKLFSDQGSQGDALRTYEKAISAEEGNFEAWKGSAVCLFTLRSYREAETAFERALEIHEDPECWYYRGLSLQESNGLKEAIECLERAVELKGESRELLALGMALFRDDKPQDALHFFERVLEVHPGEDSARLRIAECLMKLGDYEEALRALGDGMLHRENDSELLRARIHCLGELRRTREAYESSIALTQILGNDTQAWILRASLAASIDLTTEALECLKRASSLNPDDPAPKLEEARVLVTLGDYQEALQVCDEVISRYRGNSRASRMRGEALTGLERHEDALTAFNTALALSPDDVEALKGRALSLAHLNRFEEAIRSIEALLDQSSSDPSSHYWKALVLLEGSRWEEALRSLNQALYHGGSDHSVLAKKGIALLHLGRAEEGLRIVEDALSSHPGEADLLTSKGSLLLNLGRHHEALQHLEAVSSRRGGDKEIWMLKAEVLEALGQTEEALDALEMVAGGSLPSKKVWLRCSDLYMALGQEGASLASYDQAIEIDPRDAELWKGRGRFCGKLGRWQDAMQSYSVALEIRPKDADSLCAMGDAYLELGMYEEARDSYQGALSSNPTLDEALQGGRRVDERQRGERVKAFAWRILEFEAVNSRPATREEVFRYCNVPVDLLDEVTGYVNEPEPLDVLSLPEGELRSLEALSRDVLSTISAASAASVGLPPLYEVIQEFPDLDLYQVRRVLEYMQGVLTLELSEEQAPGMERLMKLALEVPKEEWDTLSLARALRIGAYEAKRLEGALRIFEPLAEQERSDGRLPSGADGRTVQRACRRHGAAGIYQHLCGQYLCSACIMGGRCPVCQHPVTGTFRESIGKGYADSGARD